MKMNLIILSFFMSFTAMALDMSEKITPSQGSVYVTYAFCNDLGAHVFVPGAGEGEKFSVWFQKPKGNLRVFSCKAVKESDENPHSPILEIRDCSDQKWREGISLEEFKDNNGVELKLSETFSVMVYYQRSFEVGARFEGKKEGSKA